MLTEVFLGLSVSFRNIPKTVGMSLILLWQMEAPLRLAFGIMVKEAPAISA